MNIVLYVIIFLSCLIISFYDVKYKQVPLGALIVNYCLICYLIGNIGLYFGVAIILYAYIKKLPIDLLYIALIVYLIIIGSLSTFQIAAALLFALLFIFFSKDKKVSFLLPLEVILVSALI